MGHSITAIIGAPAAVGPVAQAAGCPTPKALPLGLVIAALGHDQIDRLTALQSGPYLDGFAYLSERLSAVLSDAARVDAIAYVETEYFFGGRGSQSAAVFARGELAFRATLGTGADFAAGKAPINAALERLGVVASAGSDEFDTLGLARFRSLEDLGIVEPDGD